MEISSENVRVTMLIERMDDSWHTLHGTALGGDREYTHVTWDGGHSSTEMWIDLRPEPLRVGDRVEHKRNGTLGTITHSSHGVEFQVRWDGDIAAGMVTNREIKRVLEPAEGV